MNDDNAKTAAATTTSTWDGLYLRPNLTSAGAVPAASPYDQCPDIWIAGKDAIADFQVALAQSYGSQSPQKNQLYLENANIIYVRGKNGSARRRSTNVTLYRAPAACVSMPSMWRRIPTDQGQPQGSILDVEPGAVGVCDQPFVLVMGKDGYNGDSLIAHFNDVNENNPFLAPDVVVSPSALITTNLGWGQLQTRAAFDSDHRGQQQTWYYSSPLVVPHGVPAAYYDIYITPTGFKGWQARFYASRVDTSGAPIKLALTPVTADGQQLGAQRVYLEPGFKALLMVTLIPPNSGTSAPAGASAPLTYKLSAQR